MVVEYGEELKACLGHCGIVHCRSTSYITLASSTFELKAAVISCTRTVQNQSTQHSTRSENVLIKSQPTLRSSGQLMASGEGRMSFPVR